MITKIEQHTIVLQEYDGQYQNFFNYDIKNYTRNGWLIKLWIPTGERSGTIVLERLHTVLSWYDKLLNKIFK